MKHLRPILEDAVAEYVLVQAWKKTVNHIRTHNWFADTLELDRATANLPAFIADLQKEMQSPETWQSSPLRLVPAPKVQRWEDRNGDWRPVSKLEVPLRPLAHIALRDQVAATALMMCLADKVETLQGDPRTPVTDQLSRAKVLSYGNRLFCDAKGDKLHHRWGTTTTYRAYFQDYRSFLLRPELVAKEYDDGRRTIAIIQTDLSQFYDRVRPSTLHSKISALPGVEEQGFLQLVKQILDWRWHPDDLKSATAYGDKLAIQDFDHVALPQGLVASGFFANIVLLDLDRALLDAISQEHDVVRFHDTARYVDDLRLVVSWDGIQKTERVQKLVMEQVDRILRQYSPGMYASEKKTKLAVFRGEERPLIRQSRKMARIQSAVSGGFDAEEGEEIIEAVQGLVRTQQRFSEREANRDEKYKGPFSSVPDVGDGTVMRFSAARFRSVYRSLRPLLEASGRDLIVDAPIDGMDANIIRQKDRTQGELDDEARSFAYGLIESWIEDPSNVRLLRIALDVWPSHEALNYVLDLIKPYTVGHRRGDNRKVALYCLSEIFRAGATETAFVKDADCLPAGIDVHAYRDRLKREAVRLLSSSNSLPWYLKQQAYLYLAAVDPEAAPISRAGNASETKHYRDMIRFLRGEKEKGTSAEFATKAIVARRSFLDRRDTVNLVAKELNDLRFAQIAERDPALAAEIVETRKRTDLRIPDRIANDLCLEQNVEENGFSSLAALVLDDQSGPLRNEISIASFANGLAEAMLASPEPIGALTPPNVLIQTEKLDGFTMVKSLRIFSKRKHEQQQSMYRPPAWCPRNEKWRFQIGYLLRFILSARRDFTETVHAPSWRDSNTIYRPPKSHWYQRLHGFFNGHEAFGDDWLPISEDTERLLFDLLAWPGCRDPQPSAFDWSDLRKSKSAFEDALASALRRKGSASNALFLPLPPPKLPSVRHEDNIRPLRGCVVQLTMPHEVDAADLSLSNPSLRKQHRNHLATAISAVAKAIDLRETHKPQDGRLDWLILPELSVHPADVETHLVPFAREYKAIIFAGLAYEEIELGKPFVNSAKWIIPTRTPSGGLRMITRRQGKRYLAKAEEDLIAKGASIRGFRPCQWLVPYPFQDEPLEVLKLSGSICYDATDLAVPSDLRNRSDVYAISAYNQDVGTFDQMALALHYHMFQMVIIANNGNYGGSNAYIPKKKSYLKQVFHDHGQPQASISFFEIDNPSQMLRRVDSSKGLHGDELSKVWKYPPAGL